MITLDREPVNALDSDVVRLLHEHFDELSTRTDVAAVVLRSDRRVFSAGADLKHIRALNADRESGSATSFVQSLQQLTETIASLPIPTIAAIAGAATGGGLELALACDLRVLGASAKIGLPEVTVGLVPAGGGTQRLTHLVGPSTASRLILTGELITGADAHRLGIGQYLTENENVDQTAMDLASRLARLPVRALIAAKRCIASSHGERGYETEMAAIDDLLRSDSTESLLSAFGG
ncbi:enoyl-CoA hydratase/isomerase family protein (plasmid) [Prescottella equi]|uniref:enoyl-CoA hydratase/isomerase family protein n=1 Tax=Rhodococcus hoagii TaxID=43767 RepID=UPI00257854FB|nr:enoyl-CoA hydratase/isomerase family protein [Prescottella equi]WJJ14276.1 enoyl-CoA hydratase/isomerase family protein [Prescottella equi]